MLGLGLSLAYKSGILSSSIPSFFDTYGTPLIGLSLRDLGAGGAVAQYRESAGGTLQDFTASEILAGDLTTFASGNDALMRTFYNQGTAADFVQATAAEQPKGVNAGALVTENSLPATSFDGVDDRLPASGGAINVGSTTSMFGVLNIAAGDIAWRGGGLDYWYMVASQNFRYRNGDFDATWSNADGLPVITGSQILFETHRVGATTSVYVNGTFIASKTSGTGTDGFFDNLGSDLLFMLGTWQECIVYNSDKTSQRADIAANINSYYSIY